MLHVAMLQAISLQLRNFCNSFSAEPNLFDEFEAYVVAEKVTLEKHNEKKISEIEISIKQVSGLIS